MNDITVKDFVRIMKKLRSDDKLRNTAMRLSKRVDQLTKNNPKLKALAQTANDLELDDADDTIASIILELTDMISKENIK